MGMDAFSWVFTLLSRENTLIILASKCIKSKNARNRTSTLMRRKTAKKADICQMSMYLCFSRIQVYQHHCILYKLYHDWSTWWLRHPVLSLLWMAKMGLMPRPSRRIRVSFSAETGCAPLGRWRWLRRRPAWLAPNRCHWVWNENLSMFTWPSFVPAATWLLASREACHFCKVLELHITPHRFKIAHSAHSDRSAHSAWLGELNPRKNPLQGGECYHGAKSNRNSNHSKANL